MPRAVPPESRPSRAPMRTPSRTQSRMPSSTELFVPIRTPSRTQSRMPSFTPSHPGTAWGLTHAESPTRRRVARYVYECRTLCHAFPHARRVARRAARRAATSPTVRTTRPPSYRPARRMPPVGVSPKWPSHGRMIALHVNSAYRRPQQGSHGTCLYAQVATASKQVPSRRVPRAQVGPRTD